MPLYSGATTASAKRYDHRINSTEASVVNSSGHEDIEVTDSYSDFIKSWEVVKRSEVNITSTAAGGVKRSAVDARSRQWLAYLCFFLFVRQNHFDSLKLIVKIQDFEIGCRIR